MRPKSIKKRPNEFDHATGCKYDRKERNQMKPAKVDEGLEQDRPKVLERAVKDSPNGHVTPKAIRDAARNLNLAQPGRLPASPLAKPAEPPHFAPQKDPVKTPATSHRAALSGAKARKPIIEVPAEIAFAEAEEERLFAGQKSPARQVVDDLKAITRRLEELERPNPFEEGPGLDDLANELIACARTLRVIVVSAYRGRRDAR